MERLCTRRRLLAGAGAVAGAGLAGCLTTSNTDQWATASGLAAASVHQYSAPGCSCCEAYANYLEDQLEGTLHRYVPDDLDAVKREHGVPPDLESCHTLAVEGYVVEGHVPVAAIAQLLADAPPIGGIALPGMPAGSPGMPGQVDGDLVVRVVGGGRTGEVFARL